MHQVLIVYDPLLTTQIPQVHAILLKPHTISSPQILKYCCSSWSRSGSVVYIEQNSIAMDSRKVTHSPNAVLPYTTDCYAEFYDLWCDSFVVGRHAADEETYWSAIHSLIRFRSSNHSIFPEGSPINIVEIGTGSGRCFKDLFDRANDTGTPFPNVHFYGIDPSVPMLKRAIAWFDRRPTLKEIAPTEWFEGLGEDFTEKLPQLKGASDLVMWTGGGFSHLCSEEQQLAFLRQMRAALRAGQASATGIILVYDQSIPSRKTAGASQVFEVPWEGRSEDDPSLLYRKSRNEVTWEGPVRRDRWEIAIWKMSVEIHTEKVDHTLMDLDEGKWPSLVKQAGLKIEREEPLEGMGIFFFLKRNDWVSSTMT